MLIVMLLLLYFQTISRRHNQVDAILYALRGRTSHQLRRSHCRHVRTAPASCLLLHFRHSVYNLWSDHADRPYHVYFDLQGRDRFQVATAIAVAGPDVHVRIRPEFLSVRSWLHSDRGCRGAERFPVYWTAATARGRSQCRCGIAGTGNNALLQRSFNGETS